MNRLKRRLRALWHREQLDRDLEDELAFHLAMKTEEGGDAAAARRQFGNAAVFRDSCRDVWLFTSLESWWQDMRYALRTLRHNPTVTWVAILALAVGVGVNSTVFAVVSSALSFHMGVDHVDRLVFVTAGERARGDLFQTLPDLRTLRTNVRSIDNWAAYRFQQVNVSDRWSLPDRYSCVQMTSGGWTLVNRRPVLGRGFNAADEQPNAPPVVLLSHRVWQSRYAGDPQILGSVVRVDGVARAVVGVMPPAVQFPEDADLWTPLAPFDAVQGRGNLLLFGTLAPHVSLAAARGEIDGIARRLAAEDPERFRGVVANVRPFLELMGVYDSRAILIAMVVAVGFVLLIVCVDVANLLLARAAARVREISIRIAIGAGRARIIRQLLLESLILAAAGGIGGWVVALAGLRWFEWFTSRAAHRPSWIDFSMNTHVFLYLAGISIGAGILFGLAPALELARTDVNNAIKDGGRGAQGGVRGRRVSSLLVAFQMTLCVVLLAGAGLLIHSSVNLYKAPLGVNPRNVLTMRIALPEASYPRSEDQAAFFRSLNTRLRSLPGVTAVSRASNLPLSGWMNFRSEFEGTGSVVPADAPEAGALNVGPDYFQILQAPVVSGRAFLASDETGAPVAIVNRSFARRFWPGENPVGKRLRSAATTQPQPWITVVGLVPDIPQNQRRPLQRDALIYLPYRTDGRGPVFVIAATAVPPATLVNAFRREVQSLDKDLPAEEVIPLADRIEQQRLSASSFGTLFTVFAAVALLLASVGLYAVVAHAVSRRTQEIGIRMAMGAGRREVVALVLKQGMRQVVVGLAVGLPLAIAVTRGLRQALIGVTPADPATLMGVALVLSFVGLLGCALPAKRAMAVDPMTALRLE
jgi:putative ABC transport system permease protein